LPRGAYNLKPQIYTQDTSAKEAYKHKETLERTIHFKIGEKPISHPQNTWGHISVFDKYLHYHYVSVISSNM
jgi:hypothetical protein